MFYRAWYVDGRVLVVTVTFCIILPLCLLKNLGKFESSIGYLGYTSGFSLTCMVFFLIVVIYKKFQLPCPLPGTNTNRTDSTFSNYSSVYEDMCTPKYVTFNSKCWHYPVLVFPAENVQSNLLHKYQSKDDILVLTVRVAVIVAVILTVPVLFFTVSFASLFLALGILFSLVSIPLVIYDWVHSGDTAEGN
ncbi:hypothetical protein JD844_027886 [Phrynosoma platyrhinos]|uniref:Amino acid transporter transmembrane domain-containing protein n=1 Tax=Phrynosoma platyrhinos TaxID=52577 RepID=A0ABQ7SH35_PHRPL|nr:hypothetical protein JD844_027886 [Phrynosoma platyrhinos]